MNKYILSFIFAVAGLQMVIAQNTTSTEKRDSSYSRILKSTFFQTSESGWVRNGENWLYKDSITTSTPDNYILEETVKNWINEEGYNIGAVMNPLRLSLVGELKGPHVFDIVAILGREESIRRIQKAIETIKI